MKFNYAMNNIKIKMKWFDIETNKNNLFKKIGFEGFNLYLSLFKFRIYKQEFDYLFISSIALLRKETGYTTETIFDLLKIMKTLKILKFEGLSKWEYLLDENKKIKDKELIICYGSDVPQIEIRPDENGINREFPLTEDDKYINVDLNMIQHYKNIGLSERYYGLYCLLRFFGDINDEGKSYMSMEKMADTLGYDKDSLNKMIHDLNRKYLLFSNPRKNGKNGKYFENYLCCTIKQMESFKTGWLKEGIEKNIKKWDKRRGDKK